MHVIAYKMDFFLYRNDPKNSLNFSTLNFREIIIYVRWEINDNDGTPKIRKETFRIYF